MSWLETVKNNIFEKSLSKGDVTKAFEEWEYLGTMYETLDLLESCELCEHPELRYQFEIVNKLNSSTLLVGSECIKKFDGIAVIDSTGKKMDKGSARKKVNSDKRRLISDTKTQHMMNSLIRLSKADELFEIESFIQDFKERGAFTPNQLTTLFWRLKKYNIVYVDRYFKVSLRKAKYKDQLVDMENWKLKTIYNSLSPSQRDFLEGSRFI